jgi:hypothetical protein
MNQHDAARRDTPCRMAQESRAIGILPIRLRRRKPAPDIAFRQRPINRVTQRMQPDISIGMSIKTKIIRDIDATKDQGATRH